MPFGIPFHDLAKKSSESETILHTALVLWENPEVTITINYRQL